MLLYDGDKLFEYISSEIRLTNDNLPAIELLENCHIFCLNMSKEKKENNALFEFIFFLWWNRVKTTFACFDTLRQNFSENVSGGRDGEGQKTLHALVYQDFDVWGLRAASNQNRAAVIFVEKYKFHLKNYFLY